MKKGRFESSASAKKHTKKVVALLLVMLLLVGSVVGTTLAWLTAKVETVTDTFTVGAVAIDLIAGESGAPGSWDGRALKSHKMVPGDAVDYDPYLDVIANSEACFVYVKVEYTAGAVTCLNPYNIADGWTQLPDVDNVYFRAVDAATATAGEEYKVISTGNVTVKGDVTKAQMDAAVEGAGAVEVKITAYAIQSSDLTGVTGVTAADAKTAWNLANFT